MRSSMLLIFFHIFPRCFNISLPAKYFHLSEIFLFRSLHSSCISLRSFHMPCVNKICPHNYLIHINISAKEFTSSKNIRFDKLVGNKLDWQIDREINLSPVQTKDADISICCLDALHVVRSRSNPSISWCNSKLADLDTVSFLGTVELIEMKSQGVKNITRDMNSLFLSVDPIASC